MLMILLCSVAARNRPSRSRHGLRRGWAAYYRGVVSSRLFDSLDAYMWKLLYKWSAWSHPNKPKDWIVGRYFGKHNKFRNDRWVFGAPGTSAYVTKPKFP